MKLRTISSRLYPGHRCQGASMVELVISIPVLLMLGLGAIQIGLVYHAKTILNYATFEAARKGAVNHALRSPMRTELGMRLGPIFGGTGEPEDALTALMKGGIDVQDSRFTKLDVLNPTEQAFEDWGVRDPESGKIEIPNSHLRQRDSARVIKANSGVNLQDANLLKIKVTYGYKLSVPFVGKLFTRMMISVDPDNRVFYVSRRMPIVSVATVRMQSPAQQDSNHTLVASITQDLAQPTSLVAEAPELTSVPCDPYGIRDDISSDVLDGLLSSNNDSDQCLSSATTINDLLSESVTLSSPVGDETEGTQVLLTDCVPI